MTTKEKYLKQFKKVPPDKIIYISTAGDIPNLANLHFHIVRELLYKFGAYGTTVNGKKVLYKLTED